MTLFVPPTYVEHVHKGALGVEPVDAALGSRISDPLHVHIDGIPFPKPPWGNTPSAHWFEYPTALSRLSRHSSCLHALLDGPAVKSPVPVRMFDPRRIFVPRRISIDLGPNKVAAVQPYLFPGAAYPVGATTTALRGRIKHKATGKPLRWARVIARLPGSPTVVGRAHGDDRGEFLLLLSSDTLGVGVLPSVIQIAVRVYGPNPLPAPATPTLPRQDPLWDLPLEKPVAPATMAQVLTGEALPTGYVEMLISDGVSVPATPRLVALTPFRLKTTEPELVVQVS